MSKDESVLREGNAWGWIAPEVMDLQTEVEDELEGCSSRGDIDTCYKKWRGVIRLKFSDMKDMNPEEKKVYGIMLNILLDDIELYKSLLKDEMGR